jgi:hypothetical protein
MKFQTVILPFFLALLASFNLNGQDEKVDAGIFAGLTADTLIVRVRPGYQIAGQPLTNAQLTIKWSEASPVASLQWLSTAIGLYPQGPVFTADGFRYQVYGSFGGTTLNWNAGQEYPVLKVKTGSVSGDCTEFEIAQDDWTLANNGDYYLEIVGEDRTGIRYVPSVNFGSEGGYVDGDTVIYLGNTTGPMTLENYNGNILGWERRINQGQWLPLDGTAGMTAYEDTPTLPGSWMYRARVQKAGCDPQYSDPATVTVELLAIWTGAVNTMWDNAGNWNAVGVPTDQLDAWVPQTATGLYPVVDIPGVCKNLLIDPSASVTIDREGTLSLTGTLTNDGTFRINADTLSAGTLTDQGIAGSGTFVSSFLLEPNLWHLIASPVVNAVSGALLGMYMNEWDEPGSQWVPITSTTDTLENLRGFLATTTSYDNMTVDLAGSSMVSGPVQADLTNNGAGDGHLGGFNLLGNPYPSALNWNQPDITLENTDPTIYVYCGEAGNYGTYLSNDPGSCTNGTDSILGVNQGFFVKVNHQHAAGSILLDNGARCHDPKPLLTGPQRPRSATPYLRLKIHLSPDSLRDELVVRFLPGATAGFDSPYDAYDLAGQGDAPQVFTRTADTLHLAVNSYPPLTANTSIPMGLSPGQAGTFRLTVAEMLNFGPDTLALLEDLKWDMIYTLSPGLELDIQSLPEDDPDRFVLHFQVEPVGVPVFPGAIRMEILRYQGQIGIYTHDEGFNGLAEVLDPSGRVLFREQVSGASTLIPFAPQFGIYIVRVTGNGMTVARKMVW